jgi:GxxExxY protein
VTHQALTREIIGACYDVHNALGHGFVESVYHRALMIALRERGLEATSQVPLQVHYRDEVVGEFVADILVDGVVLVELKAAAVLMADHQAQVINYLRGTGMEVGLLVNFGRSRLEVKRCTRQAHGPQWSTLRGS